MTGIVQLTPFVFTRDLDTSVAFYNSLGFAPAFVGRDPGNAYCEGHGVALRILQISPEADLGEQMIYIDVNEIDDFYETLRPVLDALPEGRVRPPFDQPYGQREFHVKDPDRCLLLYGSTIVRASELG